jgi:hypothetical protein
MSYNYNPQPPRVWNRVQHECSTINGSNNNDNSNNTIVSEIDKQMLLKGNILQYKKNSANLTKNQRYSKIAKGQWTNRTKTWATQSQTYSNPNTSNLLRVNYSKLPVPFNAILPLDCSANFIKDGGNLICNKVADPCTDVVIKTTQNIICYPTTYSDVPGQPKELCWNNGTQTWYPRQNLTMNNSTDKWPVGYKGFVSAVSPGAPYLMVDTSGNIANLSWEIIFNTCLPVNSFNIYENGQFIANVPYTTTSYNNILLNNCVTNFYVTAVSGINESGPSNTVIAYGQPPPPVLTAININSSTATLSWTLNIFCNISKFNIYNASTHTLINSVNYPATSYIVSLSGGNNSFYVTASNGVNESVPSNTINIYNPSTFAVSNGSYTYNSSSGYYTVTFTSPPSGSIIFYNNSTPINVTLVAGGGGGGGGNYPGTSFGFYGGGGGGGGETLHFTQNSYANGTPYTVTIGSGGSGGSYNISGSPGGVSAIFSNIAHGGYGANGANSGGGGGIPNVTPPIPPFTVNGGSYVAENTNGISGTISGISYGGGSGGGGSYTTAAPPSSYGLVSGGGGGGTAYNLSSGGGGGGRGNGATPGSGGTNGGGKGALSNGSNGGNGTYGGGGGGGSGAQNYDPPTLIGNGGRGGNGICVLSFQVTYPP